MKTIETVVAEQSTGITENPAVKNKFGTIYTGVENVNGRVCSGGIELTEMEARERLADGKPIVLPNMGAGSYRKVFCELGDFQDVRVIDWTSSAGDWCFGVFDGQEWKLAFQSSRYPRSGFEYSVSLGFSEPSFEALIEFSAVS